MDSVLPTAKMIELLVKSEDKAGMMLTLEEIHFLPETDWDWKLS